MVAVAAATPVQAEEAAAVETSGEIVVTAQKRVQNVQDVPIAISVVGGEELQEQGSASLVDYAGYVPGMNVSNGGTPGQTTITLRGVAPLNASQTVGIYLDDVYLNRPQGALLDIYDVERIEVLRGPQGTLFGRNATAGAVSVATACLLPAGPASELAVIPEGDEKLLSIEHPTGEMSVVATMKGDEVDRAAVLRTARKLFDGIVFAD